MEVFIVQIVVVGLLLYVVARLVPGMEIESVGHALLAGLVLGIINALIKPILVILTLPITILTLGLFLLVINAIILKLAGALVPGLEVRSFGAALLGALLLSIFSFGATLIM
ncbi:phage holin family protein [bacterium]|nr:phage holin family protein [bacterium]